MTYSQARQNLSTFLDRAKSEGAAIINRADGSQFKVTPIETTPDTDSPLFELYNYAQSIDEPFQKLSIKEVIDMLHEDQDERADRIIASSKGLAASDYFNTLNKE